MNDAYRWLKMQGRQSALRAALYLLVPALLVVPLAVESPVQSATFPGPNGKIAFASDRQGDFEIYTMNADGSGLMQLTTNEAHDRYPAFSADGRKIAFASDRDGNSEIYVMNADGSGPRRLTNHPASEEGPRWSPDGSKISFSSNRDGNWEVYLMDADGTNATNLTNNSADDGAAVWSPDGTKVLFGSTRDDPLSEVYIMNTDGTSQTRLTTAVFIQDGMAAWSPDGNKIIWRKDPGGYSSADLWVMNADGSAQSRLLDGPGFDSEAVYSPDGTKIAFATYRDGNSEIYVMNADTSGQMRLTFDPGQDSDLDWQPFVSPPDCVQPPTGLVSWWPGDGNANDIRGNNDGTLQNGATFASGLVGQTFSLDGVDDYVQFGDTLDGLNGGFTLDAWIRTTATVGNKAIIANYWTAGSSWVIRTNESDASKVDFTVCSPSCDSLADAVQLVSTSNINDGAWHFIAATFDGTTQRLYVDGVLEASGTNTNPAWADNHHFCIGSFCDPSGNSFLSFSGLIDEVEIYNRALLPSEIQAIFNAASAGKCKVITVAIDIKPASFPNSINLGSNGVVPVAILGSLAFDATTVDPTTITVADASVRLKGNGTPIVSFEDVNNDGLLDLVVRVSTEALQLSDGDTQAMLTGQTFDGKSITGTDSVRIVP